MGWNGKHWQTNNAHPVGQYTFYYPDAQQWNLLEQEIFAKEVWFDMSSAGGGEPKLLPATAIAGGSGVLPGWAPYTTRLANTWLPCRKTRRISMHTPSLRIVKKPLPKAFA